MKKADSTDPAKYLPELARHQLPGRDRQHRVRREGRHQGADISSSRGKDGKMAPSAIIKSGKSVKFEDFVKAEPQSRRRLPDRRLHPRVQR